MAQIYQKVYSMKIENQRDMTVLEQTVAGMLGGEHNKCAFVRSKDFISLRLRALYNNQPNQKSCAIYGEGIKITLDAENNVSVHLLGHGIELQEQEPEESEPSEAVLLGKRPCPDTCI